MNSLVLHETIGDPRLWSDEDPLKRGFHEQVGNVSMSESATYV